MGPAICMSNVYLMKLLNNMFHQVLEQMIQEYFPILIPPDIDIAGQFNVYRSFWSRATTRAQGHQVLATHHWDK